MEKIKNSIYVKTAAFIVVILCAVVTTVSAVVVIVNAEYQWYSNSRETAEQDIYGEVASYANRLLSEELYYEDTGRVIDEDTQLIYGEDDATDFGYRITLKSNESVKFINEGNVTETRTVNDTFITGNDTVYRHVFMHSGAEIEIYIGEIDKDSIPQDLYRIYEILCTAYTYGKTAAVMTVLGIISIILLFIFFLTTTGKKKEISKLTAAIPIELCLALAAGAGILLAILNAGILWEPELDVLILLIVVDVAGVATILLGLILIIIIKARHDTLWCSSICFRIYKALVYIVKKCMFILESIPVVWKSALFVFAGILINLFLTIQIASNYGYMGGFWLLWVIGAMLVEGAAIYTALGLKKLKEAGNRLAQGDLEHKVDKRGLFLDLKQHADDLNNIGEGMARAVDEKMKSERFKTELITNVSHDIKTPLTSIINYVDLLSSENIEDEKITEYIDVLERHSKRLKKLTDDLVEASKAAAGTVKLDMIPCKAGVVMMQACGEYDEKLEEKNLDLISDIIEGDVEIMADGRSMWRIFDNILNNICKYSQPGTRVYQSLEKKDGMAVITYKNTSGYQLNISEEELMERFVRGDSSRHTEGSGLGLSIAKNLAELQGGRLEIIIDGDLFKSVLEFPILQYR